MMPTLSTSKSRRRTPRRQPGFKGGRAQSAFTLTELLLAVALMVLLASAMVFSFSNMMRGAQLEEGTTRVEGLLRYARAQAANTGRRVQLVFDEATTNASTSSTSGARISWEPDPLGQPGQFTDLPQANWQVQGINDLVHVQEVQVLNPCAANRADRETDGSNPAGQKDGASPTETFAPITFNPDGSSESVEIILTSCAPEEEQRMSVNLAGITGSISHRLVTTNDFEGLLESSSDAPQMPESRSAPEAP